MNELTRNVIPAVLADHDPYRPYLPSSPYISEAAWDVASATGELAFERNLSYNFV